MNSIKNLLIVLMLCCCSGMTAQELLRSTTGVSGSSSELKSANGTYIVQQSVGQASVIGTFSQSGMTIRQGFIQPPIRVLGSPDLEDQLLDAVLFPNPFESIVTVRFGEVLEGTLEIVIYDMLGRLVFEKQKPASSEVTLDLRTLSSAQYVLQITHKERQFKSNILKN